MHPTELNIYKLAHFLLFAVIGYLRISRRPYGMPIRAQTSMIALFALAIEFMQVLVSGRDGSLSDVLIDLFGTYCGLLTAAAIQRHCGQNRTVLTRAAMTYQHIKLTEGLGSKE